MLGPGIDNKKIVSREHDDDEDDDIIYVGKVVKNDSEISKMLRRFTDAQSEKGQIDIATRLAEANCLLCMRTVHNEILQFDRMVKDRIFPLDEPTSREAVQWQESDIGKALASIGQALPIKQVPEDRFARNVKIAEKASGKKRKASPIHKDDSGSEVIVD